MIKLTETPFFGGGGGLQKFSSVKSKEMGVTGCNFQQIEGWCLLK